jgi:hypothetical protein
MRPIHHHHTLFTILIILVGLALVAIGWTTVRLGVFAGSVSDNLKQVEHAKAGPAWWLGRSFEGMKLTRVVAGGGDRVADFGYGACHSHGSRLDPFNAPRCGYPLWIQVQTRRYGLSSDDVPKQLDGSCGKTRVRGVPAAVGTDGIIVYSGDQTIAVLGTPDQVGRALAALRPVRGAAAFRAPTLDVTPLADCVRVRSPFTPVSTRIASLRTRLRLPVVTAGPWYHDGQLINAEQAGAALVVEYASCGKASSNGDCGAVLSISSEPLNAATIGGELQGAACERTTVAGAPAVIWTATYRGSSAKGMLVFADHSTLSLGNELTLYPVGQGDLRRLAGTLRPVAPETSLPAPTYDVQALLRRCAKLK